MKDTVASNFLYLPFEKKWKFGQNVLQLLSFLQVLIFFLIIKIVHIYFYKAYTYKGAGIKSSTYWHNLV